MNIYIQININQYMFQNLSLSKSTIDGPIPDDLSLLADTLQRLDAEIETDLKSGLIKKKEWVLLLASWSLYSEDIEVIIRLRFRGEQCHVFHCQNDFHNEMNQDTKKYSMEIVIFWIYIVSEVLYILKVLNPHKN